MTVGSLFAGVGGFDLGLDRAGMEVRWQCEINPFRRGVLARHWPEVPCHEDITTLDPQSLEPVDLVCGGFPCQDLSVAGRRAGLHGTRSSLFFEFCRIVDALQPHWVLLENVPGLLSSHRGRDFAIVRASLAERGYSHAYRILDARHFGVAQRRRRVFIVGHLGADSAAPFLPFLESGPGDSPAGRAAGADLAGTLGGGAGGRGWTDDFDRSGQPNNLVAHTLPAHESVQADGHDMNLVAYALRRDPGGTGRGTPLVAHPLRSNPRNNSDGGTKAKQHIYEAHGVRRLTPVECCRLQGFPDDWLGEPNAPPDGPKYAALGDAVCVPVAEWIGRRILEAAAP